MGEILTKMFFRDRSIALPLWCALVSFVLLFFIVPYSSGYNDLSLRISLYESVTFTYTGVENGEWAFGYVVLPIALVMLWLTRDRFKGLEVKSSWVGLAIVMFGLLCYLAGFKANQKYFGFVAGHTLIAGTVIWLLGWRYFFASFWLLAFLGMMWPWIPLIDYISFPLRKVATDVTVFLWNLFGGDAIRNGTSIVSAAGDGMKEGEAYSLQIAAACSGMRSLFALLMISLIFAYVGVKKSMHRVIVVAMMIPIAVAGNVVRITLLLGGTIWWGNDFAVGSEADPSGYHLGAGYAVYFVALFCMIVLVGILNGGYGKLFKRKKVVSRKVVSNES